MIDIANLKKGARVKITLEGTLKFAPTVSGLLADVAVLWDGIEDEEDYTDISDLPVSAIEYVKPEIADGLYYDGPIPTNSAPQVNNVFKRQYGKWFDNTGQQIALNEDYVAATFTPLAVVSK